MYDHRQQSVWAKGTGCVYLSGHLWQLVGLGVQPSQGLEIVQVVVLRQAGGQVDHLVVAPLRRHHNGPNLLHLHPAA